MAISTQSPDSARRALERVLPPLAAGASRGIPRSRLLSTLVRLLVHETAARRDVTLSGWALPDDELGMRTAAEEVAAMHADGPVEWIGAMHERLLATDFIALHAGRSSRADRKRAGAFYTPAPLVAHLLDHALEPVIDHRLRTFVDPVEAVTSIRLLDPSCGGGNFLLAAARRLAARLVQHASLSMPEAMSLVVISCIHGVDSDPVAVEACIGSLLIEAASPTLSHAILASKIRHGDSLTGTLAETPVFGASSAPTRADRDAWCVAAMARHDRAEAVGEGAWLHWPEAFPEACSPACRRRGFDVIVGNPPFLNQLEKATVLTRARDALVRAVSGGVGGGYADVSATFLWRSVQLAAQGGRVAMVQPQSLLSSRDAGSVRKAIAGRASPVAIWVADERVFEGASVFTCAPVLQVGAGGHGPVSRSRGLTFEPLPPVEVDADAWAAGDTWTPLAAAAWGVPEFVVNARATIADIATATADFRDQYYGLEGFLVEGRDVASPTPALHPRLVTTGHIDLARLRWGERPVRILRQAWLAPRVDRARMEREGALGPWLGRRMVPKVLLATQTRVLEAWVDEAGEAVPCIPLLTIMPGPGIDLWQLAAAVASPVACAVAMQRHAGAALTVDAIKLSASQALRLPLPACTNRWRQGATLFKAASLAASDAERLDALGSFGRVMVDAYGLAPEECDRVTDWWTSRLDASERPTRGRRTRSMPPG